jgi:hypothetical protein
MVLLGEGKKEVLVDSQGNVRKAIYGQHYPFFAGGVYWVKEHFTHRYLISSFSY